MFTLRLLKIKIHSRRVFVFKRSLPVFAFLLAGVMIAWPSFVEHKDRFNAVVPNVNLKKYSGVDMEQVRFFSKDKKKNPLTIVASRVQEADSERKIIVLNNPTGLYTLTDGTELKSQSSYALAFQEEKYLYFEKPVQTTTDTGYQALSSKVICDYNSDTIASDERIDMKGPAGMLQAQGFFVSEKGDNIVFKNDVKALIFDKEKPIDEIDSLDFKKMKAYQQQNQKHIYLTSKDSLTIFQPASTITAINDVKLYQSNALLETDKLILSYQKDTNGKNQMRKLEAFGSVKSSQNNQKAFADFMGVYKDESDIANQLLSLTQTHFKDYSKPSQLIILENNAVLKEGINTIKADKMYVFYKETLKGQELDKAYVAGNVYANNTKQTITGESGVYNPKTKVVDVYGKVKLTQGHSQLNGDHASLNMITGISSLKADKQTDSKTSLKRVKGVIVPSEFEKESEGK